MPATFANTRPTRLLAPAAEQVVPLLVMTDDESFGAAARQTVGEVCPPALRPVQLCGGITSLPALLQQRFDYRFRTRALPLALWEHEPTWVAWFCTWSPENLATIQSAIQNVPEGFAGELRWFVFMCVPSQQQLADVSKQLRALPIDAGFILTGDGASVRPPETLGAGAAAYAFAAWSRYLELCDGDVATAWLLPRHDAPWFTLGVAADAPDLEFHREKGAGLLTAHVLEAWQRPGSHPERPAMPKPVDVLNELLPPDYRTASGAPDDESEQRLFFNTGAFHLRQSKLPPREPSVGNSGPEALRSGLLEIRRLHHWFGLVVEPNARAVLAGRAASFQPRLLNTLRRQVTLNERPEGVLDSLCKRMGDCAEYAEHLLAVRSERAQTRESFRDAIATAERRIDAIPSMKGGLLRFGLIALGLIWLCLGSLVWPDQQSSPSNDNAALVGVGAGAALVLLLGAMIWQWWYWRVRAWRAVERAHQTAVADHLALIGEELASRIQYLGKALSDELEPWRKALTDFQTELREQPGGITARENGNPRFDDKALVTLLGGRLDVLAQASHAATRQEVQAGGNWPSFVVVDWLSILRRHTLVETTRTLDDFTYDDWVRAQNLGTDEKVVLLRNLVFEARRPAWQLRPAHSPVLALAGATEWNEHAGQHNGLEFHDLNSRQMFVVSPMAVLETH